MRKKTELYHLQWIQAKEIGSGAFARVYLVEDEKGESYACKVSTRLNILRREAGLMKEVESEGIAGFIDYRESDGMGYLLMEYVKGENLEEYLRKNGPLPERLVIMVGITVAEVLDLIHKNEVCPIVFRDVKPGNLILEKGENVRLVDFGCACPMGVNLEVAGSVGYAAPEQMKTGTMLSPASDVYALGKTLQTLSGGKGSRMLRKVLERCTADEADERIPNMRWLIRLLHCCEKPYAGLTNMEKAVLRADFRVLKNIYEKD